MADDFKPVYTGNKVVGYKGKLAGKAFGPSEAEKEEQDYQAGLPMIRRGAGGAGWRSSAEGKAHREAWKKSRKKPVAGSPLSSTGM